LNFNGNSLVNMVVDQSVLNSLAENGGLIKADGGMVMLSAGAKDTLLASMVNNTGSIEAHTIVNHEGKITLLGGMAAGTVNVAGTLDATAPNGGNGGFIETSAAHVTVADAAKISTAASNGRVGTWLIDPIDFTIAASGGDMTGAAVSAALANNNFIIQSTAGTVGGNSGSGDVNVNDVVAWSANKLTLSAQNNINLNAQLNGTGSASLALEYGQNAVALNNTGDYVVKAAISLAAGDTFSTKLGSDGVTKVYTVVTELGQASDASVASSGPLTLQGMALSTNLGRNFALGSDIDASKTANASDWGSASGFTSIGTVAGAFTGTFAGLGHAVSDLTINRPGIADIGLIGAAIGDSVIRDVGLLGGSITGGAGTGGLLGSNTTGSISNSYSTINIIGGAGTGGLVGSNTTGSISNSYSTGSVSGGAGTGGLIGASTTGNVSNSYATGVVTGGAGTGGLIGASTTGNVSNSYATGEVIGLVASVVSAGSGGLVGAMTTGNISDSYATGNVTGGAGSGGLVGALTTGTISDSYATGNIIGTAGSGGLAGTTTGAINSSYATGNVSGHAGSGGLAGTSTGTINLSYATGDVTGHAGSGGLAGTTTGAVSSSYATGSVTGAAGTGGLAGTTTGNITTSYATGNVNGAAGGTGSLAGTSTGNINNSYATGTTNDGGLAGTLTGINNGSFAVSAGDTIKFEDFSASGKWTLINGQPVLTSLIKVFTITANDVTQTYNGLNFSGGNGVSYSDPYSSYLTGSLVYTGTSQGARNAGTYGITAGGLSSTNSQYVVSYVGGTLTIAKAALTLNAASDSKVYDGSTNSTSTVTASGLLGSDRLTGLSQAYASKNVLGTAGSTLQVNSGYVVADGNNGGNYSVTTSTATGSISARALTVTAASASKVYDGNATASITLGDNRVAGDVLALSSTSANFVDKNAGVDKAINVSGIALAGTDATNYSANTTAVSSATIAKADAIVTANSASTTYSGATQSVSGFTATGLVGGETAAVLTGVTAAGSGKNAGTYSVVAAGTDSNYNLTLNNGNLAVAKADAIVTANSGTGVYSGATQSVNGFTATGLVGGETAAVLTDVTAAGSGKNAGNYSVVAAGTDANYNLTLNSGSLAIAKADAIVTANSGTGVYSGATQSVSGFTASGLVGSETAAALTGVTASGFGKNAGNYSVVAAGTDANYNLTLNNGSLAIAKADAIVTANSGTGVYSGTLQSVNGFTASGLVGGETAAVLTGVTAAGSGKNAGNYSVVAAGTDSNYNLTLNNGSLAIAKAEAIVTANSGSTTYSGATQSVSGFTASGLVGGETSTVLTGVTAAGSGKNAGNYSVLAAGTDSNYNLTLNNGSLAIAKANAVVTANSASTTYSGADQSVSGFTASGLVSGETASVLTGVTASGSGKNAGNYSVVATGTDSNYNLTLNNGSLAIAKADAIVTANSGTGVYSGTLQSVNGFTASGLVGGETTAVLTGVTASGSGKNAGNYSVVAAGTDANYNLTLNSGSLAIAKADAIVTANSGTGVYSGATQNASGFTATGLVGGETTAVLTGVTAAVSGKNAGNYSVVAVGSDANYNLTLNNGSLAIAKADAVVTANSGTGVYSGATQNVSGFTATGLVGGETTDVLTGVTAAGSGKNAGDYSVVAAGSDANYNVTLYNGSLAIAKANAVVTANSGSTTYSGATQSVNGFTATGLVGGETAEVLTGVTAAGSGKNAGNYSVVAAGTDANYNLTLNSGSLAIAKADAIVTANSGTGVYSGATQSVSGFTATGLVGGETTAVLTGVTAAGSGKNAGNYSVVATGTDSNYNLTLNSGSLAIAKAALTLNASSDSKVYDGNTNSSGSVNASGLVGSDTVTSSSQAYVSKNVLGTTGSTLQVNSGYTVNDGNNGGNYTVTTSTATGSITRLNSVGWIGGTSGNWFDASNWQGGAVPDLSNVANVSIPAGINVNFNNANASSVLQGGLVQVDSIGNLGALNMAQGSLNVANNLTLAALTQSGGALGGTGNVSVNSFNQSGGSVVNAGNFSVSNAFTQTGTGIVAVGGNMAIAQLSGDLSTSSLSGNNINLTANNGAAILGAVSARGLLSVNATGNITQTSGSVVTSGSGSTLASSNGNIVLPNTGNDQGGVVSVSAVNITLTDASHPVFALSATGNSTLVSGGNLVVSGSSNNLTTTSLNGTTRFGATTLNGNLATISSGSVSQTSPVTVSGSASINTNGFDLTTILRDNAIVVTPPAPTPAPIPANLSADVQTIGLTAQANATASFAIVSNSANLAAKNSPEASVAMNANSNEESSDVAEN